MTEHRTIEQVTNHSEAWDLACHKRDESNLARCYIDAVTLIRILTVDYGELSFADRGRFQKIIEAAHD